ncbi:MULTISPECIES: DUF6223 family protein [Olivibacter]|uniref:DUF6223 family protein n=1 Tax=Olivibacter jilunii TaxID=985016 RepID=A0ABW6ATC6_9SPHI
MKTVTSYLLMIGWIVGFSFLAITAVYSQEGTIDNQSEMTTVKDETGEHYSAVQGITTGRARALVGGVMSLLSLGAGWRAKNIATSNKGKGRTAAIVALIFGVIGIVLSIIHLSITAGAVFGSGSGKAGAIVALVLGLIGVVLSGSVLRLLKGN